eukprot:1328755-Rhodomonas_salina.3
MLTLGAAGLFIEIHDTPFAPLPLLPPLGNFFARPPRSASAAIYEGNAACCVYGCFSALHGSSAAVYGCNAVVCMVAMVPFMEAVL